MPMNKTRARPIATHLIHFTEHLLIRLARENTMLEMWRGNLWVGAMNETDPSEANPFCATFGAPITYAYCLGRNPTAKS
jgi:hypothetical protein